jgi:uncharacterized Zn-finger protein
MAHDCLSFAKLAPATQIHPSNRCEPVTSPWVEAWLTERGGNAPAATLAPAKRSHDMTNEVIPHFHNDLGVPIIQIGAMKFMCMGALPPQDPHVFCDMGEDVEYVCPYCSTLYRHNAALAPNKALPAQCEFHGVF